MEQDAFVVQQLEPDMTSLRIALVTETFPPEVNGVAMTIGRMADGLRRRGHAVQIIRPRQAADQGGDGQGHVLCKGVPIPQYNDLRFGLPAKGALSRLWSHLRPDLVHVVTEGPLGWSAMSAARKLKLPVTSDFHTNFHNYTAHYGVGWLAKPIARYLRRFHNRGTMTFVPTQALRRDLEGDGYHNVEVVARGVDTTLFDPARRSAELRARWGAGEADPVALYVGRLAPEKNLPLVLKAFAAVRERHPRAKLVFVGDGPERARLAEAHPEHVFAGMRTGEDLAAHYASGDVFLFGSLTETFGNVTLEALASGLGVASYAAAAAAELIRDGANGMLAPAGDEAAFVAAACRLVEDLPRLATLRAAARDSVLGHDWERIHDAFAGSLVRAVRRHERQVHGQTALFVTPD